MSSNESDVGIRAWANVATGFTGILKQRYSDFLVNEVDPEGHVVHITNLKSSEASSKVRWQLASSGTAEIPKLANPDAAHTQQDTNGVLNGNDTLNPSPLPHSRSSDAAAAADHNGVRNGTPSSAADKGPDNAKAALAACDAQLKQFAELCGESNRQKLHHFLQSVFQYEKGQSSSPRSQAPSHVALDPIPEKGQRTAVHNFFKQSSPLPVLTTSTVSSAGTNGGAELLTVIQVSYSARGQKRKREDGARPSGGGGGREWPGGANKYCRFALGKSNMDTQQCLGLLASLLHCKPTTFATAGTKDKRAVTVQHVTAFKITAERLSGLNPRLYNFQVGNFSYTDDELHLGQLKGNQFHITLREVAGASRDQIEAAAGALKGSGFINYYGLQRFGSGSVPTHRVGAALLRGEYEQAVRSIMQPHASERAESAAAKALYLDQGDIDGALAKMPRYLTAERAVLEGLRQSGKTSYLTALQRIPHGIRTMYVHSYQSYLWNAATSQRCQHFGTQQVVQGDLVLQPSSAAEHSILTPGSKGGERSSARLAAVHEVTAEEASSSVYSIEDVVMPLPGSQARYPAYPPADGSTGQEDSIYHQLAAADGVQLEVAAADDRQAFSIAGLSGDYRRILHRPKDLSWKLIQYADPNANLAESDLDKFAGNAASAQQGEGSGDLLALQLTFQLPPSSYATMLIRELTKMATGTAVHKALTQKGADGDAHNIAAEPIAAQKSADDSIQKAAQ